MQSLTVIGIKEYQVPYTSCEKWMYYQRMYISEDIGGLLLPIGALVLRNHLYPLRYRGFSITKATGYRCFTITKTPGYKGI